MYALRAAQLLELEKLSQAGTIDLFYGDESHVCSEGYTPYGWQFPGEKVCVEVARGYKLNVWGLVSRTNRLHWATSEAAIDSRFVFAELERLSLQLQKTTVIVLDNARIHTAKIIEQQVVYWEKRGLYLFYLPPYSPQLNIAETLWRKIKKEQIDPLDYATKETLFYAINRCLAQFGKIWKIRFSDFRVT